MSFWGKIIGATAGLALGGPLGALLGGVAGHFTLDKALEAFEGPLDPDSPAAQVTFTIALIALAAKMAKADGTVTRDEVAAFRKLFQVPPEEERRVAQVFDLARQSTAGFEAYADQIGTIFRTRPAVLEDVLDGLFAIAMADGHLAPAEETFLAEVAARLGLTEEYFERVKSVHVGPDRAAPHMILGVTSDADEVAVKAAYRKLVKEHHPDSLAARGVPPEMIAVANAKLARINAAYDVMLKGRGWTR